MNHLRLRTAVLLACLGAQAASQVVQADAVDMVDVLGVYPDHVAQRVADPEALFVSNIEYANRALENSGANFRYNLVHVQRQNWPRDDGISAAHLESLAEDAAIRQLRDEHGADVVAGMVPSTSGWCGIGYLPPASKSTQTFYSWAGRYAYSLSGHNCGGRTMAHEIGHNAGLGHSPAQGSEGSLVRWGRGWGVNRSFVTIMAYSSAYGVYSSAGRLQIHSNPDLSVCRGQRCGKPIEATDGADATRALNLAAPQMADWRDSVAVEPANGPPVAENDRVTTDAIDAVTVSVLQNDYDPDDDAIWVSSVTQPLHGHVEVQANLRDITYTPNGVFVGEERFTYTIVDTRGASDSAEVSVQVEPAPDGGDEGGNLVINGGAESGLLGWTGAWGTSLALSSDARSGNSSVRAFAGRGALAGLNPPLKGNSNFSAGGWLKASATNRVYVYLYSRRGNSWSYQYLTTTMLLAGRWTEFNTMRRITGSDIEDASILF